MVHYLGMEDVMTGDQHILSNTWAKGINWMPIRKVGNSKWIIDTTCGCWNQLGNIPVVFKTKTAAYEFLNNLCLSRFREWRAA